MDFTTLALEAMRFGAPAVAVLCVIAMASVLRNVTGPERPKLVTYFMVFCAATVAIWLLIPIPKGAPKLEVDLQLGDKVRIGNCELAIEKMVNPEAIVHWAVSAAGAQPHRHQVSAYQWYQMEPCREPQVWIQQQSFSDFGGAKNNVVTVRFALGSKPT